MKPFVWQSTPFDLLQHFYSYNLPLCNQSRSLQLVSSWIEYIITFRISVYHDIIFLISFLSPSLFFWQWFKRTIKFVYWDVLCLSNSQVWNKNLLALPALSFHAKTIPNGFKHISPSSNFFRSTCFFVDAIGAVISIPFVVANSTSVCARHSKEFSMKTLMCRNPSLKTSGSVSWR